MNKPDAPADMTGESSAPRLSVVSVNYGTLDYLRGCLTALAASTLQPEFIVVDNDGSAAPLAREFPYIRLLPQTENRYFCGGNNIGIQAARGHYVLLLNPDTLPQPDALATLVAFMDEHPDYHGATLQLRWPDGRIQRTCARIPGWGYLLLTHALPVQLPFPWRRRHEEQQLYADWARDSDRDVEVMPGSCLLMRRADLWLDDDLLLYFPEESLARRFAGARFRFLSGSYFTHYEKSVTRTRFALRLYWRDLLVYTRKQHGLALAALLWLCTRPLYWLLALFRRSL